MSNPITLTSEGVGIYEITKGLYQAPIPTTPEDWKQFWELADVVVSLSNWLECEVPVPENKMLVRWPIEDGPVPDLDVLFDLAVMLATFVDDGKRVLIHCAAGANRSGLVSAMVVRELSGENGSNCAAHVRARRPGALINPIVNAYLNALPEPDAGAQQPESEPLDENPIEEL